MKLTANGKSSTQPLAVKMDPRSKATPEALQRQFALAAELSAKVGEVSTALQQANDLRRQIEERKKDAAGKADLLAALEDFQRKVAGVADPGSDAESSPLGPVLPDAEHEPLSRVASGLSGVMGVAESGDVAPTPDVTTTAKAWGAASTDALARWKIVMEKDLMEVNAKLEHASLKPLAVR